MANLSKLFLKNFFRWMDFHFLSSLIGEHLSSSDFSSLVFFGALLPPTSSRYDRVTLLRRSGSFDKVQCESAPNQMKVQHCRNFPPKKDQVHWTCENDLELQGSISLCKVMQKCEFEHVQYLNF